MKFKDLLSAETEEQGRWYCQQVISQGWDSVCRGMQLSEEIHQQDKTLTPLQADIKAAKQILGI
jgi:hypothetical protein